MELQLAAALAIVALALAYLAIQVWRFWRGKGCRSTCAAASDCGGKEEASPLVPLGTRRLRR